jgi:hypothetical protein
VLYKIKEEEQVRMHGAGSSRLLLQTMMMWLAMAEHPCSNSVEHMAGTLLLLLLRPSRLLQLLLGRVAEL